LYRLKILYKKFIEGLSCLLYSIIHQRKLPNPSWA
jgi:hypothetical protein